VTTARPAKRRSARRRRRDIVLQNADCAEEFDIADSSEVEPGTVMVIDQDGRLRPSERAYDRRVAGVVSVAGECRPAMTLGRARSPPAAARSLSSTGLLQG
jgi:hypothetical protein